MAVFLINFIGYRLFNFDNYVHRWVATLISSVSDEQDVLANNQRNRNELEFCSEIWRRLSQVDITFQAAFIRIVTPRAHIFIILSLLLRIQLKNYISSLILLQRLSFYFVCLLYLTKNFTCHRVILQIKAILELSGKT